MSQYQIKIKESCHENWDTMSAHEQGKFCVICTKEVVDFTSMTDHEVISYFTNYKGSLCGRFAEDQLEKKDQRYFDLPDYTKKFIRALAMIFIMFSSTESYGQPIGEPAIMGEISISQTLEFRMQGMVFGPTGSGIENARMQFYSKGILLKDIVTDENGKYDVSFPPKNYQLTISKKGFQDFHTSIKVDKVNTFGDFELKKGVSKTEKPAKPVIMGRMRVIGKPAIHKID